MRQPYRVLQHWIWSSATENMEALFQAIIDRVPPPPVEEDKPFQMQISQLGLLELSRSYWYWAELSSGTVKTNTPITVD